MTVKTTGMLGVSVRKMETEKDDEEDEDGDSDTHW
jgi:hypothetical protein